VLQAKKVLLTFKNEKSRFSKRKADLCRKIVKTRFLCTQFSKKFLNREVPRATQKKIFQQNLIVFAIVLKLTKNGEKAAMKKHQSSTSIICKSSNANTLLIYVLIHRVKCNFMQKAACQNVP
jgi:hypothetical protein